jgi:hypothetical protein
MKLLTGFATVLAVQVHLLTARAAPSCNSTSCGPPPPISFCPNVIGTLDRLKCIYSNSTKRCTWDVLPCPVCNATTCGPPPGEPNFVCPGGTIGGPGPCSYLAAKGKCGYPIIECTCNVTTCGAKPQFEIRCPDGTIVGPVCVYDSATNKCGYETAKCPPVCNATSCGPKPGIPNRLCPDKTTVAGPKACTFNNVTKKCGYPIVQCPTCTKNSDCKGTDTYCSTDHLCHASATCASNQDCINPDNHYAIPEFIRVGCVICTACTDGVCGRSCTLCSKVCPSATNFTNCKPCSRVKGCLECESTCF